ncbi:hypothetical protein [Entomobacter blattae]|uniref:hypothetical protein n=1 Tax=Entomobacter blattae TaxID=2762277 RepID=UPI00193C0240|nr:hypothetical protein [Entomobacter blattae]
MSLFLFLGPIFGSMALGCTVLAVLLSPRSLQSHSIHSTNTMSTDILAVDILTTDILNRRYGYAPFTKNSCGTRKTPLERLCGIPAPSYLPLSKTKH